VIIKVTQELADIAGMLLVMEVCLWIFGYCLATSRELHSTSKGLVSIATKLEAK
jgi:hypothetical protein